MGWLQRADITYWGDLDAAGFAILNAVRATHHITTHGPRHRHRIPAPRRPPTPAPAPPPPPTEKPRVYRLLFAKSRLRIEQEQIPFTHASTEIREAFF
ncbi:Wadjet anti-phage system protein JetD domain-containing protein [Corynebacterium sp. HMSC062E11]|uniref:Wadjet anti-phage system protein JetD domain-containing protein n=1 Tax=Corynebacterium sp. HMSC062E11 TaxID=1739326 RepID=UPI0009F63192